MKVKIQLVISLVFITLITYSQCADFLSESTPEVKTENVIAAQETPVPNTTETVIDKENEKDLKTETKVETIESDSTTNTTPIPVEPEKSNIDNNTTNNNTADNKTANTTSTDANEKVGTKEKSETIQSEESKKTDLNETQVNPIKEESTLTVNESKEVKEVKDVNEVKSNDEKVETSEAVVPAPKEEVVEIKEDKNVNEDLKVKDLPEADYADDIGIYSFLAVVFIASMAYMIFLIYTQNQKYDFLNYDLNREMNYQLIPDEN